jgi:hypothetical protein
MPLMGHVWTATMHDIEKLPEHTQASSWAVQLLIGHSKIESTVRYRAMASTVDSLTVLDPKRPIRKADIGRHSGQIRAARARDVEANSAKLAN